MQRRQRLFFHPRCIWCVNLRPSADCHRRPPCLLLWKLSGGDRLSINLTDVEQGWRQSRIEFQYESHYKEVRPECDIESPSAPLCFKLFWIGVIYVFRGYLRHISLIVESELWQHIAGTGWTEGVFTTSLTVSLLPYPAFISWLFWAATSKMWCPFKYDFLWKSQIAVQTEQIIDVEKKNLKMYCFFFFCRLFPITSARLFIQPGWA